MNKIFKTFLWIFLFPIMLFIRGLKKKNKLMTSIGGILSALIIVTASDPSPELETSYLEINNEIVEKLEESNDLKDELTEEINLNTNININQSVTTNQNINSVVDFSSESFEGYKLIVVDGGDQSGDREANVVVDIGFGDREYFAFTNDYGQLVKVIAKEIIIQDDSTEDVLDNGRYYWDEAKVPGVESSTLDEGHVIADSLGGVSNAYNITPQDSNLNRHGDQAYMEATIRAAEGCSDFTAIITYPNDTSQIPSHYSFTYTIDGNVIHDEFDNSSSD